MENDMPHECVIQRPIRFMRCATIHNEDCVAALLRFNPSASNFWKQHNFRPEMEELSIDKAAFPVNDQNFILRKPSFKKIEFVSFFE
jgi:hypothetical protein